MPDVIGIILLAAGESSRMGKPKQLLNYKDTNLLGWIISVIEKSSISTDQAVVVLGAKQDKIIKEFRSLSIPIVENHTWEQGMHTSIKVGLKYLIKHQKKINAVIIMVGDQPATTPEHIDKMINTYIEMRVPIVASEYNEAIGVPALFDKAMFGDLFSLKKGGGAKIIIQRNIEKAVSIHLPNGEIDIDSPDDYKKLLKFDKI